VTLSRQELEEWKRNTERLPDKRPDPVLPPDQEAFMRLQNGVGNAALARAMLNRDLPSVIPRIAPPEEAPAAIQAPIKAYLERMRLAVQLRNQEGTMSMPELVNWVRQNVPEALQATIFQIQMVITDVLGTDTPPPTRKQLSSDGRSAQVEASILNSLPKPPKDLKIYAGPGTLTLGFMGSVEYKAGAVKVDADKDGGKVTVKEGDKSVTGSASFAGDAFGLKATMGNASFDAQLKKDDATKQWSHFTANLKVPIAGGETVEERPPVEEVTESVMQAQAAIAEVVDHLRNGGSPTDELVKAKMALIKPAIGKVSAAVEQRKGPQASVKVTVGTGDPKLGSYGTVSLVIEF
jgi:hypothetical protein